MSSQDSPHGAHEGRPTAPAPRTGWATGTTHVWIGRGGWALVGLSLLWWAFHISPSVDQFPWIGVVQVAATLFGMLAIVAAWVSADGQPHRAIAVTILLASAATFAVSGWVHILQNSTYGSDELAFVQYAAQLVAHGHNPYAHSMAPALQMFHVYTTTHTLNGAAVTALSYPAMSFLIYAPFVLVGWTTQMAEVINVASWLVAMILAYALVPRLIRPFVIVLAEMTVFVTLIPAGVTDAIYVPLLIVAVYQWDRFPERRGWRQWISPVAMGLAVSVKQTPWLVLPFLLIGIYLEVAARRDRPAALRTAWSYLWRTGLAFLVVNGAFIAADPAAWVHGSLAPLLDSLIPQGIALSAITTAIGVGGGNLTAYAVLSVMAIICVITWYTTAYRRLKPIAVMLPALAFLVATRSMANYFVMLTLPAMVAACTVRTPASPLPAWRTLLLATPRRRIAVLGSTGLVAVSLIVALAWPAPLSLRIAGVYAYQGGSAVNRLAVSATNTSGSTASPVFFVRSAGEVGDPWLVVSGPPALAAGATATYVLQGRNSFNVLSIFGTFRVIATTTSPAAISVSLPYSTTSWRVDIAPSVVKNPVRPGMPLHFTVQVADGTDQPVHRAGMAVFMRVTAGPSHSVAAAHVRINGTPYTGAPVTASTDAQGVARYTVTIGRSSTTPLFISAFIMSPAFPRAKIVSSTAYVIAYRGTLGQ